MNNLKGFSLVEVLLAISLFGMLVIFLGSSVYYANDSSIFSNDRIKAIALAQDGIEISKNIRDRNFSDLGDGVHGTEIANGKWDFSGSSDLFGVYEREIEISSISGNEKRVVSRVFWEKERGGLKEIEIETSLTNWREEKNQGGNGGNPPGSCYDYCESLVYQGGICRKNKNKCQQNSENYESGGDSFCSSPNNSCCCY